MAELICLLGNPVPQNFVFHSRVKIMIDCLYFKQIEDENILKNERHNGVNELKARYFIHYMRN